MKKHLFTLTLLFSLLAGCDIYGDADFQLYYVVESTMEADSTLPTILLYTTAPINDDFLFENVAVQNAEVSISLMDLGNPEVVENVFEYTMDSAGVYNAVNQSYTVQGRRTYRLDVSNLNNSEISASSIQGFTTVPDTFRTVRLGFESQSPRPNYIPGSVASVEFQQDDQLVIDITRGELTGGRSQNVYIFTIVASDTTLDNLTPFYANFVDDIDVNELAQNESNLLNQENYELNPDNTVSIQFPWIAIAFYGQNRVFASSIDKNLFDFRSSLAVQTQGGTVSPGEIYNAVYNLEGAIGVFGSLSRSFFDVDVKESILFD